MKRKRRFASLGGEHRNLAHAQVVGEERDVGGLWLWAAVGDEDSPGVAQISWHSARWHM